MTKTITGREKMKNSDKIILDLFGGTGAWSNPYSDVGYDVRLITLPKHDVRLYIPPKKVYGILAAVPCDDLSGSGARWWKQKGEDALIKALANADAVMRIVFMTTPEFWCIENPVGRLSRYYGKPVLTFHPCDFGDPYKKRTCLWGCFDTRLERNKVDPTEGQKIWRMPPSKDRKMLRSITPQGFAKAFFKANQ